MDAQAYRTRNVCIISGIAEARVQSGRASCWPGAKRTAARHDRSQLAPLAVRMVRNRYRAALKLKATDVKDVNHRSQAVVNV